jgi:hypothetical protein
MQEFLRNRNDDCDNGALARGLRANRRSDNLGHSDKRRRFLHTTRRIRRLTWL